MSEAERTVQANRTIIGRIADNRHHLLICQRGAAGNQITQQQPPMPRPTASGWIYTESSTVKR
jgi:hypothetical protein